MYKRHAQHIFVGRIVYIRIVVFEPRHFLAELRIHKFFIACFERMIKARLRGEMAKIIYRFAQHIAAEFLVGSDLGHSKVRLAQRSPLRIDSYKHVGYNIGIEIGCQFDYAYIPVLNAFYTLHYLVHLLLRYFGIILAILLHKAKHIESRVKEYGNILYPFFAFQV